MKTELKKYPVATAGAVHNTCFGGRMIGAEVALDCLQVFLATEFEGGRHAGRVSKLSSPPEPF